MRYLNDLEKSAYLCSDDEMDELLHWYDKVIAVLEPEDFTGKYFMEHDLEAAPGGLPYLVSAYRYRLLDVNAPIAGSATEALFQQAYRADAPADSGKVHTGQYYQKPGCETVLYDVAVADTNTLFQEHWTLRPPRFEFDPYGMALAVFDEADPQTQLTYYYWAYESLGEIAAAVTIIPGEGPEADMQWSPLDADMMDNALPQQTRLLAQALGVEPPSFWR